MVYLLPVAIKGGWVWGAGARHFLKFLRRENGQDDRAVGMLWKFNDVLMAPQGHDAGATSHEGACENSNLERQGCNPFYQELIEDAYVDPVSGLRKCGTQ